MPYKWVDPEVALEHQGVKIYHTYKSNEVDQGTSTFWYGWSTDCDNSGTNSFDVRELAAKMGMPCPDTWDEIVAVLKTAIDRGILTQEGIKEVNPCCLQSSTTPTGGPGAIPGIPETFRGIL